MQIFVDKQYLPKLCNGMENTELFLSNFQPNMLLETNKDNFSVSVSCKDERSVNVRKGERICDILQQYSVKDVHLRDKQVSCQDLSEQQKYSLGNLASPDGDRQRNSFLRDLFMETYPRNGNANGRTAGVLAISNEHYRGAASVLLTNANGQQATVDGPLSEPSEAGHTSALSTNFHHWQQLQPAEFSYTKKSSSAQLNMKSLFENYKSPRIDTINPWMNYFLTEHRRPEKRLPLNLDLSINTSKPQIVNSKQLYSVLQNSSVDNLGKNYKGYNNKAETKVTTNLTKSAILNQVLESPWCPRIPNNYRPFRRKCLNAMKLPLHDVKAKEEDTANDSNNNIQTTSPLRDVDFVSERISSNGTKEQPIKCSVCDQVSASEGALASHMRRHAAAPAGGRYTCAECSKSFSQLRNFKYHMSVHRGTREFAATCPVCGKYFNDRGYLSSHMKIHRNRKEYKCSQCPKSFNQRVAYNMHVRIHTGVKPHVCGECGKAFSRKMLLKQHQRTHSGERPYACPHCDKRFADRSNMTLHLRLHTGVKPFSCSLCPKSFTKKHHLKSHLNFHTGAKPYSCPRCQLAFTQSSNMRTHFKKCNASTPAPTVIADVKSPVDT